MDWQREVDKRKESIIEELQELISIPSVLSEEATDRAPFGKEVKQALDWFLDKGTARGYQVKNVGDVAGHLETGSGEELLGILGHVDVVPAGAGWTKDPFGGSVENGKLYGRGAIDDKGPTIAAWTALNLVKDAGCEFTKRVRLIIGTDEESGFRCMDRYFETEEMPTIGFAPDADFPIIHAEKGIASLVMEMSPSQSSDALKRFVSGNRTNMVPDLAEALVEGTFAEWQPKFADFLAEHNIKGTAEAEGAHVKLTVHGKSAHAMEPEDGVNAGIFLALFLQAHLVGDGGKFTAFLVEHFYNDSRGHKLGLDFKDDVSGDTTLNAGVIRYEYEHQATIEVSLRYSISFPFDEKVGIDLPEGFTLAVESNSPPHHVDASDPLIQKLQMAYEKQTGDKATLLAIGGGTYARVLDKGVAFGMLFPGEPDVAHQADEFVDVDNLLKAVAIYAEAIYQLACKQQ